MEDIDRLAETVKAFCQFIERVPEAILVEQEWGPKEVLAHLVYHHENYVAQVQAITSGISIPLPVGRFRDLNAQAIAASRGIPVAELLTRLRLADQRLRDLSRSCDIHEISITIKQGSKPWILAELLSAIESHIRNHQKELRIRLIEEIVR